MPIAPSTQQAYVSNAVPYGSLTPPIIIKRGATTATATNVGNFLVENCTLNREVKKGLRPDEIDGDNGWWMVNGVVTGSCVIQMPVAGQNRPRNGDWFEYTFNSDIGVERMVIGPVSEPYENNGYWKSNATLTRDLFRS